MIQVNYLTVMILNTVKIKIGQRIRFSAELSCFFGVSVNMGIRKVIYINILCKLKILTASCASGR